MCFELEIFTFFVKYNFRKNEMKLQLKLCYRYIIHLFQIDLTLKINLLFK